MLNNLLRLDWSQLNYSDKLSFFNNNQQLFLEKKVYFLANAKINDEIKILHFKMKSTDNDNERCICLNKILEKDNEKSKNWAKIDF